MAGATYILDDFKVGESVVLLEKRELTYVVIDKDRMNNLIICGIAGQPGIKGVFKPYELEKEKNIRPPNIVDFDISERD